MCQIIIIQKISGWSQCIITIVIATQSRLPLASAPVSSFGQGNCSFVTHYTIHVLVTYSHNLAICLNRVYVQYS